MNPKIYKLWQKVMLIFCLLLASCATRVPSYYEGPPESLPHIVHDAAVKMDWLSVVGAVTIAFGVAGYMNGQKAATSILAAGVVLFAGGILTTMALSMFAQLKTYALIALIVLGIGGFLLFAGTSLDVNDDGKINWQDVKAVFLKIRRVKYPPDNKNQQKP
jgi:hypothetical protein